MALLIGGALERPLAPYAPRGWGRPGPLFRLRPATTVVLATAATQPALATRLTEAAPGEPSADFSAERFLQRVERRRGPDGPRVPGLRVLVYHHLLPEAILVTLRHDSVTTSLERFEEQMGYLATHGYRTLAPEDLLTYLRGRRTLPRRPVMVTFDDGYESNYVYAFPVLKRYRIKATIFLVTAWMHEAQPPYRPRQLSYLTWPEIREMARSGLVSFGSHSDDLHRLQHGRPRGQVLPRSVVQADLEESRRKIEFNTGQFPLALAYPFGYRDQRLERATQAAGFQLGFGTDAGPVTPMSPRFSLPRYFVAGWRNLSLFTELLPPAVP